MQEGIELVHEYNMKKILAHNIWWTQGDFDYAKFVKYPKLLATVCLIELVERHDLL